MPESRTLRISSSTCADSLTPSAAVGSSRMITFEPNAAARATATPWRWPPESDSTCWLMSWMVMIPSSVICFLASARILRAVELAEDRCRGCPARAARGRGTGCRRCRARGRPRASGRRSRSRSARASIGVFIWIGWPSSRISPSSGTTAPDRHLISDDLPAPLSPITARISPGMQVEVRAGQRGHVAVALDQAAGLEDVSRPRSCLHLPDPLVDGDGGDDQDADGEVLPEHVDAGRASGRCAARRRSARRTASRPRGRGRRRATVPPITTAVIESRLAERPACGRGGRDAADQHPAGDGADQAARRRRR